MFKFFALIAVAAIATALPQVARPIPRELQIADLSARIGGIPDYNIHPNGDTSKCVGIKGGVYGNGTLVDIYDCNDSASQRWAWMNTGVNQLTSVNPTDNEIYCLDAGNVDQIKNGVQMKIWKCFDTLPQQTWKHIETTGPIALSIDNKCLDLTNGSKANQNVLQIWDCSSGNPNQIWSFNYAKQV